jgi:hypothetical protein
MRLFTLVIVIFLVGCSKGYNRVYDYITVESLDFGKITELEAVDITEFFDSSHYLQLKIPQEVSFYHASKIFYGNQKYFIADLEYEDALFVFDKDGHYLYHIESGGNGPGEIPDIEDVTYDHDNNTILFLGASGRKLFEFSDEGQFIRDIKLPVDKFFNFLAYGGEGKLWLYALPPPNNKIPNAGFHLLHTLNLQSEEWIDAFLDIPEGLNAQVSGFKELSFQNEEIIFSMAFSNTVYKFGQTTNKAVTLESLANTNNLYGLQTLNEFLDRLSDNQELVLADNYISGKQFDLLFILKSGMFSKWGVWDKSNQKFVLTTTLIDGNLGIPLAPFLDAHQNRVFKILDQEFLEGLIAAKNNDNVLGKLIQRFPEIINEEEKLILCIYEF